VVLRAAASAGPFLLFRWDPVGAGGLQAASVAAKMIKSGLGSRPVPTYAGDMTSRRSVVDYGLARRATLASVFAGRTTVTDVCDAHPYLLRAAKFHGEPTGDRCPICRKTNLTHVTYVYGDELGQYEGRVKQARELAEMATEYGEFRVYVVEVCQSCGWNHLASSYVLGTGEPAVRRRRRARTSQ
jgi:hypothetical protein